MQTKPIDLQSFTTIICLTSQIFGGLTINHIPWKFILMLLCISLNNSQLTYSTIFGGIRFHNQQELKMINITSSPTNNNESYQAPQLWVLQNSCLWINQTSIMWQCPRNKSYKIFFAQQNPQRWTSKQVWITPQRNSKFTWTRLANGMFWLFMDSSRGLNSASGSSINLMKSGSI